jgi:hypothetical protein
MKLSAHRWAYPLAITVLAILPSSVRAQVFTVGEKSATADIKTDFKPTRVELPNETLSERGRRDLVRNLEAEQGFAHRDLPLGSIISLQANGNLTPGPEGYRQLLYKKGQAAATGDRIAITALEFKGDRILIDLNGGPYAKHRFLSHIQIGVGGMPNDAPQPSSPATGCRIALVFEGGIPELSAPEVKALLEPLVDFGVKTTEQAYADTLPPPLKSAIAAHEVRVGMNHRMVLAALGQPESKVRESTSEGRYEEWIYGHQPQTIQFVRFVGDRVSLIKVAALGKPIQVRDQDEMAGYEAPAPVKVVDVHEGPVTGVASAAPSLKLPAEDKTPAEIQTTAGQDRRVQFPDQHPDIDKPNIHPTKGPQDKVGPPSQ